jgi:Fungal specific transcription factor domain
MTSSLSPNASSYLQPQMQSSSNALTLSDAQSSPRGDINAMQTTSNMDLWDFGFDSQWPSWLAGDDFDLKAVNSSIAATMYQYMPSPFPQLTMPELYPQTTAEGHHTATSDLLETSAAMEGMRKRWFTHMDEDKGGGHSSGVVTPRHANAPDQANVDENYRVNLTKRLRQRVYDDSLPSTEFLNLCIRMYFARFNPIFPIIHGPSFRPSTENSLLLLSICSVGSLFIGSASATSHGIKIFETLNKSILASWESVIARSAAEALCMVQAAVIGQTFGMLSGNPRHLVLVEAFHGTVIAWARQSQIFKERHVMHHIEGMLGSADKIEKSWRSWVQSEHMIRITLGLHIQDAELAGIFHHEPLLRHGAVRLPVPSSNKKFNASSANQWASIMIEEGQLDSLTPRSPIFGLGQTDPMPSRFYAYTILEGVGAAICEARDSASHDTSCSGKFRDELISWYDKFQRSQGPQENDPLCLMILWHSVFLTLFADFDMLERAIGKEGPEKAKDSFSSVVAWASSTAAKRCIIHASLIQKQLETMRVGTEPAIHVPLALFHAALAWYCYTTFASHTSDSSAKEKETLDFPEIKHLGINATQHLFEAHGFKFGRPTAAESGTLCLLTDLLQRIGHWEIARKYASILGSLLHGGNMGMDIV